MRLLLDTHTFLWAITDDPKLGAPHPAQCRCGLRRLWLPAAGRPRLKHPPPEHPDQPGAPGGALTNRTSSSA